MTRFTALSKPVEKRASNPSPVLFHKPTVHLQVDRQPKDPLVVSFCLSFIVLQANYTSATKNSESNSSRATAPNNAKGEKKNICDGCVRNLQLWFRPEQYETQARQFWTEEYSQKANPRQTTKENSR